ncbi:E3 ubiquitin-protein ligase RNF103 [Aspergillus novofumigatus IBT 16806]|uniref:RING-type E3 ubiquitin transferase n=1 Tax=Aspergillus novofumigatus (strain IBT 16806) TaxID=1392255 RepID=A0A2I1BVV1_ASPN1|nr:putative RING finger domain protein [Aspergillus novofumigatus IBT 16806]PKX89500.1 putative RING finger domain protein [Aspergillus novofumigatus IBT 16806]
MFFEGSGRATNATRAINETDSLHVVLDGTIQTLSTQNAPDKGPVRGLLFVPSLNPQDPCNNATASLVPSNSTRHSHVAPLNFPNIGLAPWVSIDCTQSFLNASQQQGVEALIFFLPSTNDSKPPAPEDSIWNLGDDGAWKSRNNYPVYAIPGPAGETLMQQLSWYSDNATLVGFDTDSNLNESSALAQDQHGIVRFGGSSKHAQSLGFILAILGMVLVLSIIILLCYQFVQKRRRLALERHISAGEADIENFGLHQIRVSREVLDQIPTYVYPSVNIPSKASLRGSPSQTQITLARADDTSSIPSVDHKEPRLVYKETEMQASSSTIRLPETAITCESSRPPSARECSGSASRSQPTCAICLDDFVSGTTIVRELPCGHIFHPSCIDVSLTQISSLCPLCKKSVLPAEYYTTSADAIW